VLPGIQYEAYKNLETEWRCNSCNNDVNQEPNSTIEAVDLSLQMSTDDLNDGDQYIQEPSVIEKVHIPTFSKGLSRKK